MAHVGLLLLFDLADHLAATLLLVGLAFAGIVVAERLYRGVSPSIFVPLLAVAALLRALLLPLPPSLSEDVCRYVWDGRVIAAGFDPYRLAPDDPQLEPLRDGLWEGLPHRDVPTVYPPAAQALFTLSASLPASVLTLKSILSILDLGSCLLLLLLARRWDLPCERVLWYAWNPLVTVEIAAMGHIDGLGVAAAVLATALLSSRPRRTMAAAAAAAAAVLAKLMPVVALPTWARQSRRPGLFIALAGGLSLIGLLPIVVSHGGVPPGLVTYAVSWEFNGPIFEPLWRLLDVVELETGVESALDRLKTASGQHEFWNHFYPLNYPQFWAKVLLSLGLVVALVWSWSTRDTATSLRRVFGSVLIFSATVYPWYALWVLPWAALGRQRAWLALSGLLFLSYLPQYHKIPLFPAVYLSIWLPFVVLLALHRR